MAINERRKKEIASLNVKKYRQVHGEFVVEGLRSVEAAISGKAELVEIFLSETKQEAFLARPLLRTVRIPITVVHDRDLARMGDVETAQGILGIAKMNLVPAERLVEQRAVVLLDGVQDPGNVGTLLRTAAWFGADAVVAGPGTADFFNPKVVRSAMGGLWDLALAEAPEAASFLDKMRSAGHSVSGADMQGTPLASWQPGLPSVLVLGSEAHGLSTSVAQRLTERVTITGAAGRRGTESLNVTVAGGILMSRWLVQP